MAFAEASEPVWKLVDHAPYWEFICAVHGTRELCLHRSAAILRTPGEGMGAWHTDFKGDLETEPQNANQVLNRFPLPSGLWFYLNGSDAERSGIAVIERSHRPDWQPEGFEFVNDRNNIRRLGTDDPCQDMDVPGCVAVTAAPGDLICFADRTFHANMATAERRYSCGIGFRPKGLADRRALATSGLGPGIDRAPARPVEALHRRLYRLRRQVASVVARPVPAVPDGCIPSSAPDALS